MGFIRRGGGTVLSMTLLSDDQVDERLSDLDGWSRDGDAITKTFENGDFVGSVEFIRKLVEPAEGMNHHPDLELSWDKVTVSLTNHAEGGLTEADFELAGKIDALRG